MVRKAIPIYSHQVQQWSPSRWPGQPVLLHGTNLLLCLLRELCKPQPSPCRVLHELLRTLLDTLQQHSLSGSTRMSQASTRA